LTIGYDALNKRLDEVLAGLDVSALMSTSA
jgi:hypothetical protein